MFRWLRRRRWRESRRCRFVVLAVRGVEGPSGEQMFALGNRLATLDPDWWGPAEPRHVVACFLVERDGARRSREARDALAPMLGPSGAIGEVDGELIASFDRSGNVASMPMGKTINDAIGRARS